MNQLTFDDDFDDPGWTLAEARDWVLDQLDDGITCPCCGQHAQRYRWTLYRSAIDLLLNFYRVGGVTRFVESREVKGKTQGSASHLAFWDLVEEENKRRPDGGKSGWWRVTPFGESFILDGASIRKYAYVYNREVERFDGPYVTISDRLGYPFNWRDHMNRLD